MRYYNIKTGIFIERQNRFVAQVNIDGKIETVHVKNTGRCKELLIEGAKVYLEHFSGTNRKTSWSLISVKKGNRLINIDSQIPNRVVEEALKNGTIKLFDTKTKITFLKPEYTYGNSRFDFYFETETQKGFIEVKGVTLEEEGIVRFPDAKTQRGYKHVMELIEASKSGYLAYIIFVVQMKNVKWFEPNYKTDEQFSRSLSFAWENGVKILAFDCYVGEDIIVAGEEVNVRL
jgi:sugar fermentation stimulation protein A